MYNASMSKLSSFPARDITLNTKMYDEYINSYKMQNGWHPGNQEYNFKELIKLADMATVSLKGKDVLDVGCGTGDFSAFLRPKKIHRYVGIDIYKPSLAQAQKKYSTETFIEDDLLQNPITDIFDYAFCSGGFTIKLSINNYDFLEAMLTKMWSLTRIGLAFNVLTDEDKFPDPDLFAYNPEKVASICHTIAPGAIVNIVKTPYIAQIHVYMYRQKSHQIFCTSF